MNKYSFSCCLLLYGVSLGAVDIAITIDDYPLPNSCLFTVKERAQKYIKASSPFNSKIAFFCVGQHYLDRNDASLFELLQDNGHFIANHSMTHRRVSSLSLDDFKQEIVSTEKILSYYANMRKWFRYPYLDYGNRFSSGGSIGSIAVLDALGYAEGYVSINTFDWHINRRLQDAIKQQKNIDYAALRMVYLSLVEEWIEHYINLYRQILGQEVVHTLLLHDNDLNALYLSDILAMIRSRGWNIVSPEQAFYDTSWRKQILSNFKLIGKPHSLNLGRIDERLARLQVIQ